VLLILIAAGAVSVVVARDAVALRGAWIHGALWAVVGIALSLKPASLPVLDILRVPARNGIAGLIGLPILAGLAFAECVRRLGSRGRLLPATLAATLAVAAYVEHRQGLADPAFARPPLPAYPLIRIEPLSPAMAGALRRAGGPLLEVPVGEGQSAALLNARAMYRSIFHHLPIVNGYAGYHPADFPRRMALASRLPDRDALRALVETTGLEMVLVNLAEIPPEARAAWIDLAAAGGRDDLRLVQGEGTELLFQVARSVAARSGVP
jgi:hypothetical protein